METKVQVKFYYRGERQADGWGKQIVFDGYDCPEGMDARLAEAVARDGFARMLSDCGDFASTLVEIGETDSSIASANAARLTRLLVF